ncbi:hypothetical protein ACIRTB_20935 [Streptomyces sp. NPDC101158]|uniref:hypothetical protein n=1 Tax=Streptomyces sp. NPDC101158 TaxID=3366117 RepID=UPI00382B12A2
MDTQTIQNTAPAATTPGTHMYVLTLDLPGRSAVTIDGTVTPVVGATRQTVYRDLRAQAVRDYPEMARALVTFFSFEPNTL